MTLLKTQWCFPWARLAPVCPITSWLPLPLSPLVIRSRAVRGSCLYPEYPFITSGLALKSTNCHEYFIHSLPENWVTGANVPNWIFLIFRLSQLKSSLRQKMILQLRRLRSEKSECWRGSDTNIWSTLSRSNITETEDRSNAHQNI